MTDGTPTGSALPRRHLFGLDLVDAPTVDAVVDELLAHDPAGWPSDDALPVVVTPNVDQLVHLDRGTDAIASSVVTRAAWVLPDGQPIVWASRWLDAPLSGRLAGSDLVAALWPRLVEAGAPRLVIASNDEVAGRVRAEGGHAVVAPMLDVRDRAGIDAFVDDCARTIGEVQPTHVFVTLGFPKQCNVIDGILRALPEDGPRPLLLAVGASFDMHYGLVRRAPVWMQRAGLEWFFRFVQEPRRLFRRYFVDDVAFLRIVRRERAVQRSRDAA